VFRPYSLHILRVLTGLEAGKAQVFSRNIKNRISRVLEAGHGGTVPPYRHDAGAFLMGRDVPVVVLMVTLQVIAGAAT